jgi:hypothetical protein
MSRAILISENFHSITPQIQSTHCVMASRVKDIELVSDTRPQRLYRLGPVGCYSTLFLQDNKNFFAVTIIHVQESYLNLSMFDIL